MRRILAGLIFLMILQYFIIVPTYTKSGVLLAITGSGRVSPEPPLETSPEPEKFTETSVIDLEIMEAEPNIELDSVYFAYNDYSLGQNQLPVIEKTLNILLNNLNMIIVLEGNADKRGTSEYNYTLSKHRAEAVSQYLIANGISSEQIILYYYGADRPVREGDNEDCWKFNRRVDLRLYKKIPTSS